MKLTVPTNWQEDLIEKIKKAGVDTVYGKLDMDFVGGGRPSFALKRVNKGKAKLHIKQLHQEGLKFHYLLNASCLGNRELTRSGQHELNKLLDWLMEINVDGVVVTIPYLLQFIKTRSPKLKFIVSCFANVNSVEKAKFWEDLGASAITLSLVEVNRDFRLLQKIRENVSCELQLIANETCIQDCPLFFYHNNATSHASQKFSKATVFMLDYCRLTCRQSRLVNPVNFIRAAWIRPEDLSVYEAIGIDRFKLVDRGMQSWAIGLIVEAYSNRSYRGNLNDLFMNPSKSLWVNKSNFVHKFKYFFHPFLANIFKVFKYREAVKDTLVYIDNTKLDGFINHFLTEDCRYKLCRECGYCQSVAEKVVSINPEYRQNLVKTYSDFLEDIISGEMFKY